jgi:hypothetical protein
MVTGGLLSDGFIIRAMAVANQCSAVMIKAKQIYQSSVIAADILFVVAMITSGDMELFDLFLLVRQPRFVDSYKPSQNQILIIQHKKRVPDRLLAIGDCAK